MWRSDGQAPATLGWARQTGTRLTADRAKAGRQAATTLACLGEDKQRQWRMGQWGEVQSGVNALVPPKDDALRSVVAVAFAWAGWS